MIFLTLAFMLTFFLGFSVGMYVHNRRIMREVAKAIEEREENDKT